MDIFFLFYLVGIGKYAGGSIGRAWALIGAKSVTAS